MDNRGDSLGGDNASSAGREAVNELAVQTRSIIGTQIVVGALVAMGFAVINGVVGAQAALYGAFISVFAAAMLRRGVRRASQIAAQDPKTAMLTLYMGAVVRFVLVLILFGAGLAGLKLSPLPVIVGFGLTQLAYLAGMRDPRSSAA